MTADGGIHPELKTILEQLQDFFEELDVSSDRLRATSLVSMLYANRPIRLVIVGEFNSGKSTLVNALCEWDFLPVGIIPTTATINVLAHSETPRIYVARQDKSITELPFNSEALQKFTARFGEQRDVHEIHVEAPNVPEGMILIDTPGVNDINQTRSEIVYEMIPEADALLFVLDVQQPLKKSEVDFLRDRVLASTMAKTIFVLNHIDRVGNLAEIDSAVAYVRQSLHSIYSKVADSLADDGCKELASQLRAYAAEIPVFAISAKKMLRSGIAGQQPDGDPMGLKTEVVGYASHESRMQTLLDGAVGQTAALIARLRKEIKEREAIEEAAREAVIAALRKDSEVLRKTRSACETALQMVENRGSELRGQTERAIDVVFADAAASLESKIANQGIEKALQEVQQEIGRKLEIRMEDINQRVRALATEGTRQAAAFIPMPTAKLRLDLETTPVGEQRHDRLAELLQDPVNQVGFMVLAPLAALLFGWVGLAAIAFPFVARIFGNNAGNSSSIAEIQCQIKQSGQDVKRKTCATVDDRLRAISVAVLDVLDEPQRRIRTSCEALCGAARVPKTRLAALGVTANELDVRLGRVVARLDSEKRSSFGSQQQAVRQDVVNRVRSAVKAAVQ